MVREGHVYHELALGRMTGNVSLTAGIAGETLCHHFEMGAAAPAGCHALGPAPAVSDAASATMMRRASEFPRVLVKHLLDGSDPGRSPALTAPGSHDGLRGFGRRSRAKSHPRTASTRYKIRLPTLTVDDRLSHFSADPP
jgi:hypothetical protein